MQNLTVEICAKFKEARKAKGLNQSALAQAVGCKQSAVSMFEAGMATKLSDEAVGKMAELLGLDLAAMLKADEERRKAQGGMNVLPVMAAGVVREAKKRHFHSQHQLFSRKQVRRSTFQLRRQ